MKPSRGNLLSVLNLHFAGVALLLILNLVLGVRLFLAWNTLRAASADELAREQTAYRALELETRPLHDLPAKVVKANTQAGDFYAARFPSAYSTITAALDDLATKSSVRRTRTSYVQTPGVAGLVEVRIDTNLSGEYAPLMQYINGLERSKIFFIINGLTLTGQQGGTVNLRLHLTTYIHAADLDHIAPPPVSDDEAAASQEGEAP
jgi:type IV pilus assembly protein PilO